jgi:hypothetical protein
MKPLTLLAAAAWAAVKANSPFIYINGLPLRAVSEALGCTVDYNPRSGVFIWGGQNPGLTAPQVSGLPSDQRSDPRAFPPDSRPTIPQPPLPGHP